MADYYKDLAEALHSGDIQMNGGVQPPLPLREFYLIADPAAVEIADAISEFFRAEYDREFAPPLLESPEIFPAVSENWLTPEVEPEIDCE